MPHSPPMASFLFRIGTLAALAAALAPAAVPNRYARGERRDQGRSPSHAFRSVSAGSGAAAPDPIGAEYVGRVAGVSDGDTIRVLHNGHEVRVRLHGIDCPEKAQPFGTRAKQFTGDLVFAKDVRIRVRDVDRYGRTVAEVVLADDGRMLNRELVAAGLAWWYRQYARYDDRLRELERDAREARRGL